MGLEFQWDAGKARRNVRKHGVSFEEASTVFADPRSITIYDEPHSTQEDRYVIIGKSVGGRLLVVPHAERGAAVQIISARPANRRETRDYENEMA